LVKKARSLIGQYRAVLKYKRLEREYYRRKYMSELRVIRRRDRGSGAINFGRILSKFIDGITRTVSGLNGLTRYGQVAFQTGYTIRDMIIAKFM